MTATTIKVPKRTRDRLRDVAAAEGLTMAQAVDKLLDEHHPRPRPRTGGFRRDRPISQEDLDELMADGFGE